MNVSFLCLLLYLPAHLIDPKDAMPLKAGIKVENASYTATIASVEHNSFGRTECIGVLLENKLLQESKTIKFFTDLDSVNHVYIYDKYFVLDGQESYDHDDNLFIFDVSQFGLKHEINHNFMEVSPSKRFLVYKTGTSRHGNYYELKTALIIYDFEETRKEHFISWYSTIGWPLYPENIRIEEGEFKFMYFNKKTSLYWSADEKQVVFIAEVPDDPEAFQTMEWEKENGTTYTTFLIQVDLSKGADEITVEKYNLEDPDDLPRLQESKALDLMKKK